MQIPKINKNQNINNSYPKANSVESKKVVENNETSVEDYAKYSKACANMGKAFIAISKDKPEQINAKIKDDIVYAQLVDENELYEAIPVSEEDNIVYAEIVNENELYEAIPIVEDDYVYAEIIDENELLEAEILNFRGASYSNPKLDKYTPDKVESQNVSEDKLTNTLSILTTKAYFDWHQYYKNNSNNLTDEEIEQKAREKANLYRKKLEKDNSNFMFAMTHPQLFPGAEYSVTDDTEWYSCNSQNGNKCAWKMHIFSDNNTDWKNLSKVIIPYLQDNDVTWKTISPKQELENFEEKQKGKAFTIYPKSNSEMEQIAKDIDYIIRKNNLQYPNSNIIGDSEMGDSGRLFYRYEYNSQKYKDKIININDSKDMEIYDEIYESNRGSSNYLASDMTINDDIWYNFDPSKP